MDWFRVFSYHPVFDMNTSPNNKRVYYIHHPILWTFLESTKKKFPTSSFMKSARIFCKSMASHANPKTTFGKLLVILGLLKILRREVLLSHATGPDQPRRRMDDLTVQLGTSDDIRKRPTEFQTPQSRPLVASASWGGKCVVNTEKTWWWFFTNPFEKYAQPSNWIMKPRKKSGWTFQTCLKMHHYQCYQCSLPWLRFHFFHGLYINMDPFLNWIYRGVSTPLPKVWNIRRRGPWKSKKHIKNILLSTKLYIGCLIGILIMAFHNPYIAG